MKNYYLNIFQVSENQLATLMQTALGAGGDYADLYFENTTYFNLMLKDGTVSSGGFHTDFGVGIRVIKGEKTGYAYSESTELSHMLAAAKAAAMIAAGGGETKQYQKVTDKTQNFYPMQLNWREQGADKFVPFLKELEQEVFQKDNTIVKVIARMSDSVSDVMMYNSLGELTYETRPMGSVTVTAVFQRNGVTENKTASRSYRIGAELIGRVLIEELAS